MSDRIPIGVPPGTKLLRIERVPDSYCNEPFGDIEPARDGYWIIWQHTKDYIHGTFLKLYDTGKMERVTVYETDAPSEDIMLIKPED